MQHKLAYSGLLAACLLVACGGGNDSPTTTPATQIGRAHV